MDNQMNINKDGTQLDITENTPQSKQEEKSTNVVPLHAIAGGGSGEYYWLLDLQPGAHFLVKPNRDQSELKEFWLIGIGERARQLELILPDNNSLRTWVDPIQFSKDMILYEILEK